MTAAADRPAAARGGDAAAAAVAFVSGSTPGIRLVVRTRIDDGYTDAVGYLRSLGERSCVVETKRGPVTIELADIVAAKEVPPPPAPRAPRRETRPD